MASISLTFKLFTDKMANFSSSFNTFNTHIAHSHSYRDLDTHKCKDRYTNTQTDTEYLNTSGTEIYLQFICNQK